MSRFRIVIQRIDDAGPTPQVTDLDYIDVPAPDARLLEKETALDHLEAQTLASGHEVMRQLLVRQWERVDAQLVANHQELFSPQTGEGGRPRSDQGRQPTGDPSPAPPGAAAPPGSRCSPRPRRRSSLVSPLLHLTSRLEWENGRMGEWGNGPACCLTHSPTLPFSHSCPYAPIWVMRPPVTGR